MAGSGTAPAGRGRADDMGRPRTLPLHQDGSTRFLPWLIALMVFLAALAVGAAFALDTALERWNDGLRGTLTVQLPRPAGGGALAPATMEAALAAMRAVPGIVSAVPLDAAAQSALLKPWLGDNADAVELPLPALVDLRLAAGASIDDAALARKLDQLVPGARVETHGAWLDQLFRLASMVEIGTAAIVLLIGSVAIVTVIFTTRTGLMIHAPVVDLLHLMGAPNFYIARQFQWHAFRLGFRGGIIGLVLALLAFGALYLAAQQGAATADLMPGFRLPIAAWISVLALPLGMGLAGLVTARITVLRALARMP
jgi:cell division transport system permease protein